MCVQAEETLVSVVPKFRHDRLQFLTGTYGPFVPQRPVVVPLWLACRLVRQDQCTLVRPEWLNAENLEACKEEELSDVDTFSHRIPRQYREICALIFEDDASGPQEVIEDIATARFAKIRRGILDLAKRNGNDDDTHTVKMNSVGSAEVAAVRDQLATSLKQFADLRRHLPVKRRYPPPRRPETTAGPGEASAAHPPRRQLRRFR